MYSLKCPKPGEDIRKQHETHCLPYSDFTETHLKKSPVN